MKANFLASSGVSRYFFQRNNLVNCLVILGKNAKIAWQSWTCKRALCLIRRSQTIITSWIQICVLESDRVYSEWVALKFRALICDKQRFKKHWEWHAMAAIQEGKVILFCVLSNSQLYIFTFKIHLKSELWFRYFTEDASNFFHSEYS